MVVDTQKNLVWKAETLRVVNQTDMASAACFLIAAYMYLEGHEEWGWFIFLGIVLH